MRVRCLTPPLAPVVFVQWPSVPCSSFCTTTVHDSADGSGSPTSGPFRGSWSRHSSVCAEGPYRHSAQEELTPACMREVKRSVFAFPSVGVLPECVVH
jgi:hypothetical protein